MKKINIIFLCLLGVFISVSCEDSTERDPVYSDPTEFVLNTPALIGGCYDLANTAGIELTWSQPNYGFAAATDYYIQVSMDGTFSDETTILSTSYNLCNIELSASELAAALCEINGIVEESEVPDEDVSVWIRLKAQITDAPTTVCYSNSLELTVKYYYAIAEATLPTEMYLIGAFCDWSWDSSASMVAVHSNTDRFWTIRYLGAGEGFKLNSTKSWDGAAGFDGIIVNSSDAGEVTADGDGNITVEIGGWYIVAIQNVVVGASIEYYLDIFTPDVYVYGAANGGTWENSDDWKFEVIDDPDAEYPFVSPTVLATDGTDDSCLRLCICPDWGIDWWKTEFIFFDNVISYRADGDDQDRVGSIAGQVKLNFATGAATVE